MGGSRTRHLTIIRLLVILSIEIFICGLISPYAAAEPQSPGLFYIYELKKDFWWRYPLPSVNCNKSNGYLPQLAQTNSGMGELLDADQGLFSTWHFSMFNSLYNRLKRSPRRTRDPEQASFFVVPYDMALDGYIRTVDCAEPHKYPRCSKPLVIELKQHLKQSKYFHRYQGGDHLLLWSLGELHPRPADCQDFTQKYCADCTLTCYWMSAPMRGHQYISLPFPSSFHYHDNLKIIPWKVGPLSDRPVFASYAGSAITLNPDHTKIRKGVIKQCKQSPRCTHLNLKHSSFNSNIIPIVAIYRKSIFCMCPPGDDPGRKALFDMLMMGCIPVLFHHSTLHNQLPYYINESFAKEISIFIPGKMA